MYLFFGIYIQSVYNQYNQYYLVSYIFVRMVIFFACTQNWKSKLMALSGGLFDFCTTFVLSAIASLTSQTLSISGLINLQLNLGPRLILWN